MYDGRYSESTYGSKRRETFERICSLPEEKSDNHSRCEALERYCIKVWGNIEGRKLLDVGSGLGIFPAKMVEKGWNCTALDPDPKATQMISDLVGCNIITADFLTLNCRITTGGKYDIITFNKVLEHVKEPKHMLDKARDLLIPGGLIYFEVPDGDAAIDESPEREEFYIEHHHVFTTVSAAVLAKGSKLKLLRLENIKENSGKYTIRAYCQT